MDCHFLLQEVKREKTVLKLNIKKTKIMASSPITSWEKVEAVTDFILGYSLFEQKESLQHRLMGNELTFNFSALDLSCCVSKQIWPLL